MPRVVQPAQIRSNIDRLKRRRSEIDALDPWTLRKYDPKTDALQASLDESLSKAFGGVNDRYRRYRRTINWAAELPSVGADISELDYRADVAKGKTECVVMLDAAISALEEDLAEVDQSQMPSLSVAKTEGDRSGDGVVFIGHGRTPVWRELKDFLEARLKLKVAEFNSVSIAGVATAARLKELLQSASFAFLVMTAEDVQLDGRTRARENVVHEIGLFQGRLGFERAIVLLEDGCEEFSNIHGLGQIRFPKGDLSARFEEIRRVLEREGLLR